jgi:hypothetical protein
MFEEFHSQCVLEYSHLGTVEKLSYCSCHRKTGFVGTALVAVRVGVRTGTSPVPTLYLLFEMTFSTRPLGEPKKDSYNLCLPGPLTWQAITRWVRGPDRHREIPYR